MLCSQLVALHSQGMEFLRRGMLPEQPRDGVDCKVNRATKLLRTFATISECLRTYRGGRPAESDETMSTSPFRRAVRPLWGRSTGGWGVGMQNKTANEPHATRFGWLKNANPPGNPASAPPRCGARTRRGTPCECPAVRGKKRAGCTAASPRGHGRRRALPAPGGRTGSTVNFPLRPGKKWRTFGNCCGSAKNWKS